MKHFTNLIPLYRDVIGRYGACHAVIMSIMGVCRNIIEIVRDIRSILPITPPLYSLYPVLIHFCGYIVRSNRGYHGYGM
jgi:hypothetical protein